MTYAGSSTGSNFGRTRYGSAGDYGRARTDRRSDLEDIRRLAHLLDDAFRIPVINYRFGLDAALGLVPVVGDVSGFAISSYIVYKAAALGVPQRTIARMVFNILLDAVVGSIPVLGSIFDIFWKANLRNIRLIERHLMS